MDLIARELYDFYGSTDSWEIYNDAVAFLKALKESHPGVKTGMITNFDRRILSLLEQFGISDLIDVKVNTKSMYLIFTKGIFSAPRKWGQKELENSETLLKTPKKPKQKTQFSGISVCNKLRGTPRFFTLGFIFSADKQCFFSTIFRQFQANTCRNFELEENFG